MTARLVIVGGGFAGLWAALAAARAFSEAAVTARVTVVSRDEYLTIRPRLYEADPIALRERLSPTLDLAGVELLVGAVCRIDREIGSIAVRMSDGSQSALSYDRLIVASGSELAPLAVVGAAEHSWNIDTFGAALAFDAHLARLAAEDRNEVETFVIVGAGFTGIELATELRTRLERHKDVRFAADARIILVERALTIGPDLGEKPRPWIEAALRDAGVEVRLGTAITRIAPETVILADGERIASRTVVVTAGLRASSLAGQLGARQDDLGRVHVDEMLRVEGQPKIFAAGDVARAFVDERHLALMSCQHGMTMGKFAGHNAAHDLLGLPLKPYRQPNYVTCLDLGVNGALFTRGWEREVELSGAEAKALKRQINTQWIYPPCGDRAAVLAAAAPNSADTSA